MKRKCVYIKGKNDFEKRPSSSSSRNDERSFQYFFFRFYFFFSIFRESGFLAKIRDSIGLYLYIIYIYYIYNII